MAVTLLKRLLPNRPIPVRIWRGPMRGARIVLNPRHSIRKILGLYEHEVNPWLEAALRDVNRVIDVGANDGYFTFGCASAFRRLGKVGEIMAFEPRADFMTTLRQSLGTLSPGTSHITLVPSGVGSQIQGETTTLDAIRWRTGDPVSRIRTLLKIDVEGAEIEVLDGGGSWLDPSNRFLIEVHRESYLDVITKMFTAKGIQLERVNQHPLKWLPREERDEQNWWLLSQS